MTDTTMTHTRLCSIPVVWKRPKKRRVIDPVRWSESIGMLFGEKYSTYDLTQLSSTFVTLIEDGRLPVAVDELLSDDDIFVDQEWFVMRSPRGSDGPHRSTVIIDLADNESEISLRDFCFALKMAMVYHGEHVDPAYDPWSKFEDIDRFCVERAPIT